jgi:hypothetical protein
MSRTTASRIAWSTVAFVAMIPPVILAVGIAADAELKGDLLVLVLVSLFALVSAVVGALIASRQPSNPIGWLFCGVSAFAAVSLLPSLLGEVAPERAMHGVGQVAAWFGYWAWVSGVPLAILVLLLFPDGRLPSSRWRWAAWCGIAGTVILGAGFALQPGPLADYPAITNPLAIDDALADALERTGMILASLTFAAAIGSVVVRYRRAGDVARQQIKWLVAASFFTACCVGAGVTATLLDARSVGNGIMVLGILGIPVAIGVAMLRYRLYEVDRVISRTIVYAALTVILGAAYAGLVLAGQALFSSVAGGGDLVIAVSTLVVAALFLPLRARVQRLVDRRFYRRRYDTARTLGAFGARVREQVELDGLRSELAGVVSETMQPVHVSVWLRAEDSVTIP